MNIKESDLGNPTIHNGPNNSYSISSGGSTETTDRMTDSDYVDWLESNHPEMAEEFRRIQREQYVTMSRKQYSYGKGNILLGGDSTNDDDILGAVRGIVIRMNDKMQRLINLVLKGRENSIDNESVEDTFLDASIYAIIALIVQRKKWL